MGIDLMNLPIFKGRLPFLPPLIPLANLLMKPWKDNSAALLIFIIQRSRTLNHLCSLPILYKSPYIKIDMFEGNLVPMNSVLSVIGIADKAPGILIRPKEDVPDVILKVRSNKLLCQGVIHIAKLTVIRSSIHFSEVVSVHVELFFD
jgi:hypothetical protein